MTGYYTSADVDRLDVEPLYRPNWRDRARWAREKQGWDAPTPDPTPACEQDAATIAYLHERLDRVEGELEVERAKVARVEALAADVEREYVSLSAKRSPDRKVVLFAVGRRLCAALDPQPPL